MKKKIVALMMVLLLGIFAFTACAEEPAEPATADPGTEAEGDADAAPGKWKVALCVSDATAPAGAFYSKMFLKHADEYNIEMTILDGRADPATQAQQITDCVAQGYDGVVVAPNDPNGVVPSMKAAKEAGLIVATFSGDVAPENYQYRDFQVAPDDTQGGIAAGKAFVEHFPDGAKIVEIGGQSGSDAQNKRHDGFMQAIEGSNIEVLAVQNVQKWEANEAMNIMQNFIVKYGKDIQGIYCHWDGGLTGCVQAMKSANMDPTAMFSVGVDGNQDGFNNVRAGEQALSIMQNQEKMAQMTEELMEKALNGEEVEEFNMPAWDLVTLETIDNFTAPEW